jgi:hypothetical protein
MGQNAHLAVLNPAAHILNIRHQKAIQCIDQQIKKVKAIPLQAWAGPEGSRRLRLSDFKTIGT